MATTSTTKASSKRQSFKWTPEMTENLIESVQLFKASVTFKNLNLIRQPNIQLYVKRWLLFIKMVKLYLAPLRLQIGLRTLIDCQEDQVTVKKEIKIQKDLIVKRKIAYRSKQRKSGSHFPKPLCRVHAMEVVNLYLNIKINWSPYRVVLLILSLYRLDFLMER